MKTALAFLAAIVVPVCFVTAWYLWDQFAALERDDPYIWVRTGHFMVFCTLIAAAHVIVLGIPAYAVLRWRNAVRWWSAVAIGAFLGAPPSAWCLGRRTAHRCPPALTASVPLLTASRLSQAGCSTSSLYRSSAPAVLPLLLRFGSSHATLAIHSKRTPPIPFNSSVRRI